VLDKIGILLFDVKPEHVEPLLKVFHFFNIGFAHELEGEYLLQGLPRKERIETSLYVQLYLASENTEFNALKNTLEKVFRALEIRKYLFLPDLMDDTDFLGYVFGGQDALKNYNPLANLTWSEKDNKWLPHKLFDEKGKPVYPSLTPDK